MTGKGPKPGAHDNAKSQVRAGAYDLHRRILTKLAYADDTLGTIRGTPGLGPRLMDRVFALEGQCEQLTNEARQLKRELDLPRAQAEENRDARRRELDAAKQRALEARGKLVEFDQSEREDGSHLPASPSALFQAMAGKQREMIAVEAEASRAEQEIPSYQDKLNDAEKELQKAIAFGQQRFEDHRQQIEELQSRADDLLTQAQELHKESTIGKSLAEKGIPAIDASKEEFEAARKYHRRSGLVMLGLMLVVVVCFVLAVKWLFLPAVPLQPPQPPTPHVPGTENTLATFLFFGGRLSLVLGAAWLAAYLGQLHSRHSQQAIIYNDRVAGLEAVRLLVNYAEGPYREKAFDRIASAYLALDTNAFAEVKRHAYSKKDLETISVFLRELRPAMGPKTTSSGD